VVGTILARTIHIFTYRALDSRDLEAAGRLLVEAYPHRADEPRFWHQPAPSERPQRWGAFHHSSGDSRQLSREIVAYAALWKVEWEKFRFDVVVSPRYSGNGIGRRLFDRVIHEARLAGAATLQARACDDAVRALAFLTRRGFVETMRMRGFVLELMPLDTGALAALAGVAPPPDVSIAAVSPAEAADPGFWSRLADLQGAAREGWPDPDPGGPVSPPQPAELRSMLTPSGEPPVAFFVASRRHELVGYSCLIRRRTSGDVRFAATAVHPEVRRQGLATMLRARCLLAARGAGCATLRSSSGNEAILRINARFGFKQTHCEVRLVRRLK